MSKEVCIVYKSKIGITPDGKEVHFEDPSILYVSDNLEDAFTHYKEYSEKISYDGFAEVQWWTIGRGLRKIWRYEPASGTIPAHFTLLVNQQ
jgi:hypothetical protein